MSELPEAFDALLGDLFDGEERVHARASFGVRKPVFARVNTLRCTRDDALAALTADQVEAQPVAWMPSGLRIPAMQRPALVDHPLVQDGSLYIQGASSWLPVLALDAQPGEEVLDLAAAPGGKSLHLAACMQDRGRLACVEAVKPRFFRLKANLERAGVSIGRLYLKDGRRVGRAVPERFDRVLLDAPCSSEAQFRLGQPETWAHWSPRKIKEQSRKQKGLIRSAWQALKPGGTLVYATCSLSPEEDEAVVDHLLQRTTDAQVVQPQLPESAPVHDGLTMWRGKAFDPRVVGTRRVRPSALFDAFFLAVLRKIG